MKRFFFILILCLKPSAKRKNRSTEKKCPHSSVTWTSVQFNQWIITTGVLTCVTASLSRHYQIAFSLLPVPFLILQIAFGNSQHVVVLLLVFQFRCFRFCFAGFAVSCCEIPLSSCSPVLYLSLCFSLILCQLFCFLSGVGMSVFAPHVSCFFQLLSSDTVWFALSFVFCLLFFFVLDPLI